MKATGNPTTPCNEHPILVHSQTGDRGSPRCCQPAHPKPLIDPLKVLSPDLGARIIQRCPIARFRVNGMCRFGLAQIAVGASQTEVFRPISTGRNDVLDVQRLSDVGLARLAVFAASACALIDQPPCCRPGQITHPAQSRSGRMPAHARLAGQPLQPCVPSDGFPARPAPPVRQILHR